MTTEIFSNVFFFMYLFIYLFFLPGIAVYFDRFSRLVNLTVMHARTKSLFNAATFPIGHESRRTHTA